MVRALSNDLRKRVVSAVQSGETSQAVAARFGVAVSSVMKWSRPHRAGDSVSPDSMGGSPPCVLEPHRTVIAERIEQVPSLTLHKLKADVAAGHRSEPPRLHRRDLEPAEYAKDIANGRYDSIKT